MRGHHRVSRRIGEEVAKVADVEEVVEARVFGPSRRLRVEAEVVDVVGVAEVVDAPDAGR